METLKIDIEETFEQLPNAPIVEAVIDLRARPAEALEEDSARSELTAQLPDYSFLDSQREFRQKIRLEAGKPPAETLQDLGWKGVRFRSTDERHIVQFNRDGYVFSRLAPYTHWKEFTGEGLRHWKLFRQMARPAGLQRIGLRFINRIELPRGELRFEDYLQVAPASPHGLDLPFVGFVHRDTLAVPGHPYAINLIRTIQTPDGSTNQGIGIILDIDVFTTQELDLDEEMLPRRLREMQWLKNKAFFGSVTSKALETCR